VEYGSLGQDFRTRGARQEEQIELLRRLFTEPVVDFTGRFDRIDRAALQPTPAHRIPIWLGGFADVAYDRAARLADGFIFFRSGIEDKIDAWNKLRDRVVGHGRAVDDFGGEDVVLNQSGDIERLAVEVDAWRNGGGTHVSIVTMRLGLGSVDGHIDYLASVASKLGLGDR
jgi:alkanesulfonate monooxygenase SsuD/methylene tetrahydromethanopterin reductase-like flavin-dependent oxidoreductase (luciferase family)